ncbi:MAG: shikimate kinase [Acidobacteria bacterium]|nr:shikimate kinase [Acidobacteriota bacterium]MBI3664464.1 shikimate kinase [Acidobacteriota bacterium]
MGSGKTTVGQLLARQMGWHFVDLDAVIEERAGVSIPAIFERLGEPAFRELEHQTLVRTLGEAAERERPTVVALGGGTFAQPESFAVLRSTGCAVVWLHCPIEHLLARCATITNRPLFRDEASFRQLYEQRLPFYEQADYRVDGTAEPRRVVEQILARGHFEKVTT